MANYAFFRPTSFTEQSGYRFDEFVNSSNAYDIGNDTYCKTDTDGKYTNRAFGSGLVFVPNSQTAPYKRHIDFSSYSISESLPQGAVIVSCACGLVYSNRVSIFGNGPNIEIGVTRSNSSTDTSFFDAYGSYNPGTGNTNLKGGRSSWTVISDVNTVINQTASWLKNNAYLMYTVNGKHSLNTSSTVIYVYEIFAFCRWKLPFRISLVNGNLGSGVYDNDPQQVYEYNTQISRFVLPNEGYSGENPIITFSQGNPSYTYSSSGHSFNIPRLQEGVNVKIEFRKEHTITVNAGTGGTASSSAQKVPDGSQVTLTATPNTGYRFVKWSDGNTNATRTITPTSDVSYTAEFALINYTINFIGNNNTGGNVPSITATYNSSYNLTNSFTRINYIFNSWNTKADGSGVKYNNKQSVSNLTAKHNDSITLYAQWDFVGDINYENLFSFSQWATSENGQMGSRQTTSELSINIQEGSLTIKDNSGETSPDAYTKYANNTSHYTIPVKSNTRYKFSFNIKQNYSSNDIAQFFIFYYTDTGNASSTHAGWRPILTNGVYTGSFTTPANCTKIGMRFGVYSAYAKITFSNICIYEANQENKIKSITNYKHRDYIPNTSSLLNPNRVGYDFNKWINSSGATLDLNGIKNGKTSVSAFSQWTPYNYYIEFNGNGADNTGTMSTQTFTYDQEQVLTSNAFSRYRYNFVNWNTKADGSGTIYVNGAKILNLTTEKNKTITLFAQWDYIPLETSIFIDDLPVKQIYVDFIKIIEVFKDKEVFFRSPIKED